MLSLESVLVALQAHAAEPRRAGRTAWRSRCPRCGAVDALGVTFRLTLGVGILARCGCSRRDVLAALGLEGER